MKACPFITSCEFRRNPFRFLANGEVTEIYAYLARDGQEMRRKDEADSFLVSLACFNVLFIPCGRLSWLHVSYLLHVKYTISYRKAKTQCLDIRCSICYGGIKI